MPMHIPNIKDINVIFISYTQALQLHRMRLTRREPNRIKISTPSQRLSNNQFNSV